MRPGVQDQLGQHGKNPSLPKSIKIRQVWWYMPVVLATLEGEVGGLSEPREFEAAVSYDYATGRQPG